MADTQGEVALSRESDECIEADADAAENPVASRATGRGLPNPLGRLTHIGRALVVSGVVVAALAGLTGWLGYRGYEQHQARVQRQLFIQTARQGAVNLTTLNYTEIDADVQRILDSATGAFREDFEHRAKPFIELVKAAQSKSEGTVTEAGLESQQGDSARVLVAVAVKSRTAAGEEAPREWRMRIDVQAVGSDAKMSNVVFVP
ncbi:Mce protein [Mycobacterium vicinigordonae]|uniref:Mce protein n=1 Tax=Mycobacterium vicinigordonae TaxID=1719132 RepID=A0A7D6E274_9MYCO|nr:Mce protein [Mycobacterium vicinigordonae]